MLKMMKLVPDSVDSISVPEKQERSENPLELLTGNIEREKERNIRKREKHQKKREKNGIRKGTGKAENRGGNKWG